MNIKCKLLIVLSFIFMVITIQVQAEKYKGSIVRKPAKDAAACLTPAKTTQLELNNVRAFLRTNGTMWFMDGSAAYEVPKGSEKMSLYSASLWIGGYNNGNLYMAAMRFGQVGQDYWTGPLNVNTFSIEPSSCSYYDQFYRISRMEVERHLNAIKNNEPNYEPSKAIKDWPAHGRAAYGESRFLAPYCDVEGDPNKYEPDLGDYPYYDLQNLLCPWTPENIEKAKKCPWINEYGECDPKDSIPNGEALPMPQERIATKFKWDNMMIAADHVLKGDETVFWFLNDRGGQHKETGCNFSIGLEIRVQAFAFATNDELNKMTFYSYEIINRGKVTLYDTYFSQWCDPDLGYANDDYVGCDVIRGLGYCYNGTDIDGNNQNWAYGTNPPAVGLDFFQGPYIDADGADNPKFLRQYANIKGDDNEKAYCRRFVHNIFSNFDVTDTALLTKTVIMPRNYTIPGDSSQVDTLRWIDQFAINGVNFGDGIVDNERFGMRAFTYHNNANGAMGDPDYDYQYYYYLTGRWKDGKPFIYGGTGHPGNSGGGVLCKFVFPRGTDFCNWGTQGIAPGPNYNDGGKDGNWSEERPDGNTTSSPNKPEDRRFMQSAGPFTLKQGACNYITVGVPWARSLQGGAQVSVDLLMIADDKCQSLFENCFKLLDGPDAPELTIKEYDNKLILLLTNPPQSNNANEDYWEFDSKIPRSLSWLPTIDSLYRFEGYQVFQVRGPEVGANDLENPDMARLVFQCDIVNDTPDKGAPIGNLINWEYSEDLGLSVPKEKVRGTNTGIQHSFEVTQDLFATGDKRLVNYKTYYFIAVAYAYNEYYPFSIDPAFAHGLEGQKLPYLRGRKTAFGASVVPIQGIPHPPTSHEGVTTLNCDYGSIPYITRIDGQGNGGIALDLTKETVDKIMNGGDHNDWRVRELKYEKNAGPLNIKVIDPLRVKPFDYTLAIKDSIMDNDTISDLVKNRVDVTDNAHWVLTIDPSVSDDDLIKEKVLDDEGKPIRQFVSQVPIGQYNEQIIMPLGLSVAIYNRDFVSTDPRVLKKVSKEQLSKDYKGDIYRIKYAFYQSEKIDIENDILFENNNLPWITGLVDDKIKEREEHPSNWIRAGFKDMGNWVFNGEQVKGTFYKERLEDFHFPSKSVGDPPSHGSLRDEARAFKDYSGKFGTLCGGTWAPYVLATPYDNGPQAKYTLPETFNENGEFQEPAYGTYGEKPNNYYNFKTLAQFRNQPGYSSTMTNLYSVDIVLTNDKSKWTRCIVLEACQDPSKAEGGALKNEPRKHVSVKQDGTPDYDSKDGFGPNGTEGMGWFPGYAINLETGERLNIMFAENSDTTLRKYADLVKGNDMLFNPTSTYAIAKADVVLLGLYLSAGTVLPKDVYDVLYERLGASNLIAAQVERIWGGMHYVYVCNSAGNTSGAHYLADGVTTGVQGGLATFLKPGRRNFNLRDTVYTMNNIVWGGKDGYIDDNKQYPYYECGPYDKGQWLVQKFKQVLSISTEESVVLQRKHTKMQLYSNVMYTHIPMQPEDPKLKEKWLSCDVTYKIRVTRPYMRYVSRWYESPESGYIKPGDQYAEYKGFPVYQLSTRALAPTFNDTRLYQTVLDKINIVPNPYNGMSFYEKDAIDTKVKITNLPAKLKNSAPVTITIYTVNGTLVRTLTKGDEETTFVDWDLKNYANIPIASGVYIIHVNCPGIGERMLKFFCLMRQPDLKF